MRDDGMAASERRSDEPIVCNLQERIDRCRLVALLRYPCAYTRRRSQDSCVRRNKKSRIQLRSPR